MAYEYLAKRLAAVNYVPILTVRPAEMRALEELPENDKQLMLPVIVLRPWLNANDFESSAEKLDEAYGKRTFIADLDREYDFSEGELKPAAKSLKELLSSADGFKNWCEFVDAHPQMIPVLQIGPPGETEKQIAKFVELDRGIVVRLPKQDFGYLPAILSMLAGVKSESLLFIFDFEKPRNGDLANIALCDGLIKTVLFAFPACGISVSATTFPESFDGVKEVKIEERQFYSLLCKANPTLRIHYGDWGSARAERNGGGGGRIIPRIDYPVFDKWYFFRKDQFNGYVAAAQELTSKAFESVWKPVLPIWGTQMIERTAKGDKYAIVSPVRATAVRINLHLHRQIYFDNPKQAFIELDDDWVD
jgi:Beta protein